MFDVTDPCRVRTMTKGEGKGEVVDLKGLLARDEDFLRAALNRSGLRSSFPARPICCSAFRLWSASLALPTA